MTDDTHYDPLASYYEPRADWRLIPEHMREGLAAYVMQGRPQGSFVKAVLCNDLMAAARAADDANYSALADWAVFLFNYAPARCWGSPESVEAWETRGGLNGKVTL